MVINGFVINGTSQRLLPEQLTHLYIIPLASNFLQSTFTGFNTSEAGKPKEAMTVEQIITKMCIGAGYTKEELSFGAMPTAIRGKRLPGLPINPGTFGLIDTLYKLSEEEKFVFSQTAAGLGFYPRLEDSPQGISEFNRLVQIGGTFKPIRMEPLHMRGPAMAGVLKIEIPHILDASLIPGTIIDLAPLGAGGTGENDGSLTSGSLITMADSEGNTIYYTNDIIKMGVLQHYMIVRVIHRGDNYGDDWDSRIIGGVPTTSKFTDRVL